MLSMLALCLRESASHIPGARDQRRRDGEHDSGGPTAIRVGVSGRREQPVLSSAQLRPGGKSAGAKIVHLKTLVRPPACESPTAPLEPPP